MKKQTQKTSACTSARLYRLLDTSCHDSKTHFINEVLRYNKKNDYIILQCRVERIIHLSSSIEYFTYVPPRQSTLRAGRRSWWLRVRWPSVRVQGAQSVTSSPRYVLIHGQDNSVSGPKIPSSTRCGTRCVPNWNWNLIGRKTLLPSIWFPMRNMSTMK